ncbi:MAG: mechanosensitive ion channel [Spirochaetales bacterium]|nr:mechanosensitive ion channel [Spirochaetales bacterium]
MKEFFSENQNLIIYLFISFGVILFLILAIQILIRTSLKKRTELIEKIKVSETVETSTPLKKTSRAFKKQAKEHLRERFSIFKRVAIAVSVISVLLITSIPFMDRLPQAFISILVGSTAIITGMAAKPFIENFLSGIAITVSKMLKIGDTIIINDNYGTIEDISPTHTVVKIWNWRRYVIPNSAMINSDFINLSLNDKWLWAHVEFFVSYESNIKEVREIALSTVLECKYYNDVEPPSFWVMKTEKDGVKCWVAAWATSPAGAWEIEAEIRTNLIINFQEKNIQSHINYHKVHKDVVL